MNAEGRVASLAGEVILCAPDLAGPAAAQQSPAADVGRVVDDTRLLPSADRRREIEMRCKALRDSAVLAVGAPGEPAS